MHLLSVQWLSRRKCVVFFFLTILCWVADLCKKVCLIFKPFYRFLTVKTFTFCQALVCCRRLHAELLISYYPHLFLLKWIKLCFDKCSFKVNASTVNTFIFVGISFGGLLKTCILVEIWFLGFANLCLQSLLKICYLLYIQIRGLLVPKKPMKIGI